MKSAVAILAVAAMAAANPQLNFNGPSSSSGPGYSYDAPNLNTASSNFNRVVANRNPVGSLADSVPGGGVPGQDYPVLALVPDTGFTCTSQQLPGYYADTEAGCQVFHICQFDGRQDSFLCPNGSIFDQQYFVCDWWFNVDCAATQQFIGLNAEIGKVSAGSFVGSASNVSPSVAYGTPRVATSSNSFNKVAAASNSFKKVTSATNSFNKVAAASNSFNQVAAASNSFNKVAAASNSFNKVAAASNSFNQVASASNSLSQVATPSNDYGVPA